MIPRFFLLFPVGVLIACDAGRSGSPPPPVTPPPTSMVDPRLDLWCRHQWFSPIGPHSEEPCDPPEFDARARGTEPDCELDDGTPVYHQGYPLTKHMFDLEENHVATWLGVDVFSPGKFSGPFFYGQRSWDCVFGAGIR